jgi:hypothetical protein
MKKRVLIALGVLAILALLTAPAFAGEGGRARAGANQYTFYHSGDVQPVPPYGSIDIEGSSGKLIVNQPEGEVSVVFTANFNGLLPSHTYLVYIMNYGCPGAPGWTYLHRGPWTLVGSFTTDEYGHGDYHQNIWAGDLEPGTYNLSIWINDAGYGKTLLISENFQVVIE